MLGKKLSSLCLLTGLLLNMLLEAANDRLYAKWTCLLQLAKAPQKPDERPSCSFTQNAECSSTDPIIGHFCSAVTVLWSAFGPSSLIAWVGSEQAATDTHQQPATVPSLPQAEGAAGLIFGKIPRYHKPTAVSLYSIISVSDCICNHQGTGYKAQACSWYTEICLHF